MPTNEPWWQPHSSKKRWKGWAAPLATGTQLAADTPAATDEGGPSPWDIQKAPWQRRDVDFDQQLPQATSCWSSTIWEWTQSPSTTRQKYGVTFDGGRAPLVMQESLEYDARVDEAHQLPPPMWQTETAPHKEANWLRLGEVEGDEDLECPPPLEPHLKEPLGEEEPSPASAKVRDDLLALLTSMPKCLESSPLCQSDWILWHAKHVLMPPWWRELVKVHGNDNC